jgi:hypothetical protein
MNYLAIILLFMTQAVYAGTTTGRFNFQQTEIPQDPALACQLKRVTLFNSHQVDGNDDFTSMATVLDTTSPDCLRNYAVVQWIRGCVYEQMLNIHTNKLSTPLFLDYQSRGQSIDFNLPTWRVDSLNADPFIAAKDPDAGGERFGWYYVPKKPLSLLNNRASLLADQNQVDHSDSRFFLEDAGNMNPTQVYVDDLPAPAYQYFQKGSPIGFIDTPSLEFKTCVYDTQNVPTTGDPATPDTSRDLGGPIVCYDWSHKYEYDLKTHQFNHVTRAGIDPVCGG